MINNIQGDCDNILDVLSCRWKCLHERTLFLTGGTGLFGKWFLHSFLHINKVLQLNTNITVLSRTPNKFLQENPCFADNQAINFVEGDIRSFTFPNNKYHYLIHAATPASAKLEAENPDEMYSIIVNGTKRVLDFAKQSGVKKILLTSSGAVYGIQPPELSNIPETYEPNPVNAYGKGKLESEYLCLNSGINTAIARCFAFVGPYLPLDIHYAIGNFIRDAINGNVITVKGDGRPYRSYLYTADLMIWLWTILLEGTSGETYNVGSEEAISIAELAKLISAYVSPSTTYKILGEPDIQVPASRYVPNTHKAQLELGLKQHYLLPESIKRTIQWAQLSS